jgi:high-affinity K+ transport system ATPase subunit B
VWQAFVKLNPRAMIRIPVMFLVEAGSVITKDSERARTITYGNRMAAEFIPVAGVTRAPGRQGAPTAAMSP